jgi:bifunctional non-homologous end joining protein LigD
MPKFAFPPAAVQAEIARPLRLQIVSPSAQPPDGAGWLHEVKHDGRRLLAIVDGGELNLISRNGHDRTALFGAPFDKLAGAGLPAMVLDGEIAVPDERGVTHIDALTDALRHRRPERLAYFAFDLLHLDGHDLRACAIEDRKALLRDVIGSAGCARIVGVDHITSGGSALFEAVRQIGAEGIVSKRSGSAYSGGESRDWLKTKVTETAAFVITGYIEREAVAVAELRTGC